MERKPAHLFRKALVLLVCLTPVIFAPVAAQVPELPEKFEANYKLKMYGITLAEATHTLQQTDNGLSMKVNTYPVGLLAFLYDGHLDIRSEVEMEDGQLLLVNHDYTHSEDTQDSTVRYDISWINNPTQHPASNVKGLYKGETITIDSDKPVWDPLSIQALIIINADKETASYEHGLLMKGELKHYIFENKGQDTIRLNGADITALKTIVKEAERDREIYVWMLPEHHNIPVRYEHWKNGDLRATLLLQSVTFEDNGTTKTLTLTHSTEDEDEDEDEDEEWW